MQYTSDYVCRFSRIPVVSQNLRTPLFQERVNGKYFQFSVKPFQESIKNESQCFHGIKRVNRIVHWGRAKHFQWCGDVWNNATRHATKEVVQPLTEFILYVEFMGSTLDESKIQLSILVQPHRRTMKLAVLIRKAKTFLGIFDVLYKQSCFF